MDRKCRGARTPTLAVVAALAFAVVFAALPPDAHAQFEKLTFTHARNLPPFSFIDRNGEPSGILVDFWNLWGRKNRVQISWKLVDWRETFELLRTGGADVHAGIPRPPGKDRAGEFTPSFMTVTSEVFVSTRLDRVKTLDDVGDLEIGVLQTDSAGQAIHEHDPILRVRPYESLDTLFGAAATGDIKVFVQDHHTAMFHMARFETLGQYRALASPLVTREMRAIVKRNDPALLAFVSNGLEAVTPAEKDRIQSDWLGLPSETSDGLWKITAAGAGVLLVLGLVAHGLLMRIHTKRQASRLVESERTLTTLISNLPGMAYRCRDDDDWTMEFVSEGSLALTGYPPAELVESSKVAFSSIIHTDDLARVRREIRIALDEHAPFRPIYRIRTVSGEEKWVSESGCGIFSPTGELTALEGFICDVTDQHTSNERLVFLNRLLEEQATHDQLTALPNRRLFLDRLEQALGRAQRHRRRVAILFIDLDDFKRINDELGHRAGDQILKAIAMRLRNCVRQIDTPARLGGDEFAVVLEDVTGPDDTALVIHRITREFSQSFSVDGRVCAVTASIGISMYPDHGENVDTLISHADVAMYRSKSLGKNAWTFYSAKNDAQKP